MIITSSLTWSWKIQKHFSTKDKKEGRYQESFFPLCFGNLYQAQNIWKLIWCYVVTKTYCLDMLKAKVYLVETYGSFEQVLSLMLRPAWRFKLKNKISLLS